jgi:hypothetical protein
MAMQKHPEKIIFEYSRPGRGAYGQWPTEADTPNEIASDIPANLRRKKPAMLPEVSELEVVRHFTKLSQLNFSIDTHFYPLGSCTMKYNPKACNQYAMLPGLLNRHPLARLLDIGVIDCWIQVVRRDAVQQGATTAIPFADDAAEDIALTVTFGQNDLRAMSSFWLKVGCDLRADGVRQMVERQVIRVTINDQTPDFGCELNFLSFNFLPGEGMAICCQSFIGG